MVPKQQFSSDEPVEVFRQFAWHLAGSLASGGKAAGKPGKVRPPGQAGKNTAKR